MAAAGRRSSCPCRPAPPAPCFAATGQFGEPGQREVAVWTSANGTVWSPSQISGLTGAQAGGSYRLTALAPAGSAVTGIGSIATQQSLEPFTVTLPAG